RVNWYVIVAAVTLLLWSICPPTVLYSPLKPTPVVRWTVIVIDSDVMVPVLARRRASSPKKGPLALITGVRVTPHVPPPPAPTGRARGCNYSRGSVKPDAIPGDGGAPHSGGRRARTGQRQRASRPGPGGGSRIERGCDAARQSARAQCHARREAAAARDGDRT